jgi:hypothetical protein
MFGCVVLGLLFAYVGTYYRLSRRGMHEAEEYGSDFFLYTPTDEVFATKDLTWHHRLAIFFGPANWVDQTVFGGPEPITWIDFVD